MNSMTAIPAKVGVDRIKIYNLIVLDVADMGALTAHDKVSPCGSANYQLARTKRSTSYVQGQCIADGEVFNELRFGAVKQGNSSKYQNYCILDFSATNVYGVNLDNLSIDDIVERLFLILTYLKEEYGVLVCAARAKIKYMEINTTIQTDTAFEIGYERPVKLIMANLPKRLGVLGAYGRGNGALQYSTYQKGNKSLELIIYDKEKELKQQQKFDVGYHCVRVELKLKTEDKIKSVFSSNGLYDLTDTIIENYYRDECTKLIGKPLTNWAKTNQTELAVKAAEYRQTYESHWLPKYLEWCLNAEAENGMPKLLDIQILFELIRSKKIKSTHQARLIKELQGHSEICTVFFRDGRSRLNLLLSNIGIDFRL